jgi:hypothetical protein
MTKSCSANCYLAALACARLRAVSTVSFNPTALVTATSVESRGFPRSDNSRYRLSCSTPAALATLAMPRWLPQCGAGQSAERRVPRYRPTRRSGTRRQTWGSRATFEACDRHARCSLCLSFYVSMDACPRGRRPGISRAVPTGLGSPFAELTPDLRPGLQYAAPSGLEWGIPCRGFAKNIVFRLTLSAGSERHIVWKLRARS